MPETSESPEKRSGEFISPTSLRSIAERGVHLLWTLHFVVTLAAVSAAFGIILFDGVFCLLGTRSVNYMTDAIDVLLLVAVINVPICLGWRYLGVLHLRFLDHESYLLADNEAPEESFVSSCGLHLTRLLTQLERAPVMDRQAIRRQVRVWLDAHHAELTERELDDVEERCPYLFNPAWRRVARVA